MLPGRVVGTVPLGRWNKHLVTEAWQGWMILREGLEGSLCEDRGLYPLSQQRLGRQEESVNAGLQ